MDFIVLLIAFTFVINANAICQDMPATDGLLGTLIQGASCAEASGNALGFSRFTKSPPFLSVTHEIKLEGDLIRSKLGTDVLSGVFGSINGNTAGFSYFANHGFTKPCQCTNACPVATVTTTGCANGYIVAKTGGGFACVKFGSGLQLPDADSVTSVTMAELNSTFLTVTVDADPPMVFTAGRVMTATQGKTLRALVMVNNLGQGVFFSECGPFLVSLGFPARKRQLGLTFDAVGAGTFNVPGGIAAGDPHLSGAHGIKFDVFGQPGANYSLLVAPAFEVNMQLAKRGPELRFMTAMSVLYRGKSFTITPWTVKAKRAELIAHFESLGSKISIKDNRVITIELCAGHTISFATLHIERDVFLNFRMEVPGCHDAYGGLLGQTYQCKYATETFEWSRDREDDFRVSTLDTASGSYTPTVECANEDEYRGEPMSSGSNDAMSIIV